MGKGDVAADPPDPPALGHPALQVEVASPTDEDQEDVLLRVVEPAASHAQVSKGCPNEGTVLVDQRSGWTHAWSCHVCDALGVPGFGGSKRRPNGSASAVGGFVGLRRQLFGGHRLRLSAGAAGRRAAARALDTAAVAFDRAALASIVGPALDRQPLGIANVVSDAPAGMFEGSAVAAVCNPATRDVLGHPRGFRSGRSTAPGQEERDDKESLHYELLRRATRIWSGRENKYVSIWSHVE